MKSAFSARCCCSCCEEGMLSQEPNPNAQPHPIRQSIRLNVSNETRQEKTVTVHWQLRRNTGDVLQGRRGPKRSPCRP